MTKVVAESNYDTVCQSIGGVEEDEGRFMRVKVNLDIPLPLCNGRVITLENGNKHWVSFRYERLPNICYWCGRLDHDDKDCALWINSKGSLSSKEKQYNQKLRASPYRSYNKPIVFIPGFYENVDRLIKRVGEGDNMKVATGNPATTLPVKTSPIMEMDTHKEIINANVILDPSVTQYEGDLTIDGIL